MFNKSCTIVNVFRINNTDESGFIQPKATFNSPHLQCRLYGFNQTWYLSLAAKVQAMPVFWEHMVRQLLPNKCYSLLQRNNRTDSNYIQSHPNISRRQSQIFISLRKIMIENHFSQRSNCFPFWSSSGLGLDKKIRILLGTNAPLWAKRHLRVFYSFRWRDYAWLVETKLGRATRRLLNTVANYHCWHFKYDQKENFSSLWDTNPTKAPEAPSPNAKNCLADQTDS